uniref:Uncharacterized protein n=1 Tax=Anguilla anguilla TaxID=7936 RepID=A0A0E9WK69_ANGAN
MIQSTVKHERFSRAQAKYTLLFHFCTVQRLQGDTLVLSEFHPGHITHPSLTQGINYSVLSWGQTTELHYNWNIHPNL